MKILKYILIMVVLTICSTSLVHAISEINIPITEFAIIAPHGRPLELTVLVSIPLPESLSTMTILHAEITCDVSPRIESDSTFELAVYPIGVSWDPDEVSWDNSWQELGGNLIDSLVTLHSINIANEDPKNLDITDIIRRWLDASYANNGIAVKTPADMNNRFRVIPRNEDSGELVTLRILYTD